MTEAANKFHIEFDTEDTPGKIKCTVVTLEVGFMGPDDVARVDLSDHPLYPSLFEYCVRNPPKKVMIPPFVLQQVRKLRKK